MHKKKLAAGIIILFGGGYLAGQAVSSHIFEREFSRAIEDINTRGEVRVERREVDKGWFSSSGVLQVTPILQDDWQAKLPYRADHGVLSTAMKGELELALEQEQDQEEGTQTIELTELLGADPIVWQADYHTFSEEVNGELLLDTFSNQTSQGFLEGQGATVTVTGTPDDMALKGTIAPWSFSDKATFLELAGISFASNYRQEQEGRKKLTQGQLTLEGIQLQQPGGPEVEIDELRYQGKSDLGAENLRLTSHLAVSEMRVDGQPALAGELDLSLSRIDAAAYRDFEAALRRELDAYTQPDAQAPGDDVFLNDKDMMAILDTLEPEILAMLTNSPRLTLKKLNVISPLLGIRSQLSGELRFAAKNSQSLSLGDLDSPAEQRRWRRHLNGELLWQGVPSLVAMQLGLPLDDDTLEIAIDAGRVSLDGEPLSPLP